MATDALFYKLAKKHPAAILKLLGMADDEDYEVSSLTLKATENRRDLVFKKRSSKEVVFVESHGYADPYVYHGLLDGIMLYCRQMQFTGNFRAAVIFLEKSHHQAALKLAHHFDGHAELSFRPIALVMNQIKVEALESLKEVCLIPLYPLCKVSSRQIEASLPAWGKRIKQARKITEAQRADLLALLGGFAIHRVKRLTLEKLNDFFGGFKMQDTLIGKQLIDIGLRRAIFSLIEHRFGAVPGNIRRRVEKITNPKRLERIVGELLRVNDLKQLEQLISPNGKSTSRIKGKVKAQHGVSR